MNKHDEAVRLLANGFSEEFAEYCAGHERIHDLMQELAMEFIEENIPIVNEEVAFDVGTELLMSVTVRSV